MDVTGRNHSNEEKPEPQPGPSAGSSREMKDTSNEPASLGFDGGSRRKAGNVEGEDAAPRLTKRARLSARSNVSEPIRRSGRLEELREREAAATLPINNAPTEAMDPESVTQLLKKLKQGKVKTKGVKPSSKEEIIDVLQKLEELSGHGFDSSDILKIWDVAIDPDVKLNLTQRRNLMWLLVPQRKLPHYQLLVMVEWLKRGDPELAKPLLVNGLLQMITIYTQQGLLDSMCDMADVLDINKTPFAIPWKMRLFRAVINEQVLTKTHVDFLYKLLDAPGLKKVHVQDIRASLAKIHELRRDLFEPGTVITHSLRRHKFPRELEDRVNKTKRRICGEDGVAWHPLGSRVFHEALPEVREFRQDTLLVKMLKLLEREDGPVRIAFSPVLLQVFVDWLEPLLNTRFHLYSDGAFEKDKERYLFLMRVVNKIHQLKPDQMDSLNLWLSSYCLISDNGMDKNLSQFVRRMASSLSPLFVNEQKDAFQTQFLQECIGSHKSRFAVWNVLADLLENWMIKFNLLPNNSDQRDIYISMMEWVFSNLNTIAYIHVCDPDVDPNNDLLLKQIEMQTTQIRIRLEALQLDNANMIRNLDSICNYCNSVKEVTSVFNFQKINHYLEFGHVHIFNPAEFNFIGPLFGWDNHTDSTDPVLNAVKKEEPESLPPNLSTVKAEPEDSNDEDEGGHNHTDSTDPVLNAMKKEEPESLPPSLSTVKAEPEDSNDEDESGQDYFFPN